MSEQSTDLRTATSDRIVRGALLFLLAAPLLALMYLGTFSRFLADDYCTNATLVGRGFLGSQAHWYLNWSGRYSFTFLINLTQAFGATVTPLFIALAVPLWLGALVVSLKPILHAIRGTGYWGLSLLLGSLILVATVNGTPDLYQSALWQTGLVTYVIPLIFGTAYLGWVVSLLSVNRSEGIRNWQLVASLAWTFVAGGFSETYVSVQTAGLLLLTAATFVPRWRSALSPIRGVAVAGLIGSLLSMAVIIGAPGNEIRRSLMPDTGGLLSTVGMSIRHTLAFVAKTTLRAPATTILAIVLPAYAAIFLWPTAQERSTRQGFVSDMQDLLIVIPVASLLLIFASVLPSVFATSAYPVERSLITGQYVLIGSIVLWSFILGTWLVPAAESWFGAHSRRRMLLTALILVFTLVGALATTQRILHWIPDATQFAETWDRRDTRIRESLERGDIELAVASLSHMGGLAEIGYDPAEWINICIADSYGLVSVVAR